METRLFTLFEDDEKQIFLSHMEENTYPSGEIIFTEGDKPDMMYLIEEGTVQVYFERKGKEIDLAQLAKGDFFGEMAILRKDKRSASIKTIEESRILSIDRETIINIVNQNGILAAKFLFNLAEIIAERLAKTNKEVENYFLISDALVENEAFRKLYFKTHKK